MKSSESKTTFTEELKGTVSEVIKQVRRLIKEGSARRLIIENKEGKVLFQTQLTAGVAGTALVTAMAPVISAIGMFALFMNDVKIIVERYPEEEMDKDEYEVDEAEVVIDIEEDEGPKAKDDSSQKEEETEKTVGKEKQEEE
ncbi:DUF4342 domain-containing protein [Halalkalibaculum sp. DA3122]|uniref:DUF4342 domain-containing protein n=1 Tax=unclassified Halalkalibaculum TaxID=2964617 RepID=UPI0037540413